MPTIEANRPPNMGDYFVARERDLFRVEEVAAGRVLLEDCRTEVRIDVAIDELTRLRRVERGEWAAEGAPSRVSLGRAR